MELHTHLEPTPSSSERKKETPLSSDERAKLLTAKMFGQAILIGRYVNTHMPADLINAWKENEGDASMEVRLKEEKFRLEAAWSAAPDGTERFASILREITDRALAATGEAIDVPTAPAKDQDALRFTRSLLKLADKPHPPQDVPTGYVFKLSEEEEALANQLQSALDRLEAKRGDRLSIVH